MSVRITGVSTAVVEANFDYTFVRVHTNEGVHGTGESFPAPALVPLLQELGETLVGQSPRQVVPLVQRMRSVLSGTASSFAAGIAYNAMSGLETALWDLAGKLDGRPVAELLGGRFADEVPLYMDCHAGGRLESLGPLLRYRTPFWASESGETEWGELVFEAAEPDALDLEACVVRAREAVELGFRSLKFDLDAFATKRRLEEMTVSSRDLAEIVERARHIRASLDETIALAFDCHWRFDVPSAIRIAHGLEELGPLWLEDPVPPDPAALAAVRRATSIPIATGENTYLLEGFRALIAGDAVSIVTPDVQKAGGIYESKRIFDEARLSYLQAAPHCISSPLGMVAAAHACAAATNVLSIEWHGSDVPFWHDLVDRRIIDNGSVVVPREPGLGVELIEDVVRKYSRPGLAVFAEPARSAAY